MIVDLLNSGAPLLLAALGGLLTELAGVLNIALEGMILTGAFAAVLVRSAGGSWALGAAAGVAAGLLTAGLFSLSAFRLRGNIFVTGLGINILMPALIASFSQSLFGNRGVIRVADSRPPWAAGGADLYSWLAAVSALLLFLLLYRSYPGLALRAAGEREELLLSRGLSPRRVRSGAVLASGALSGLAGAALAHRLGAFVPGMSAGRGWIALVAIYLGYKKVPGIALACLLFAGAEGAANRAQGSLQLPPTLVLSFPYFLTLLVLVLFAAWRKRS